MVVNNSTINHQKIICMLVVILNFDVMLVADCYLCV